jgi:hypothetical protein
MWYCQIFKIIAIKHTKSSHYKYMYGVVHRRTKMNSHFLEPKRQKGETSWLWTGDSSRRARMAQIDTTALTWKSKAFRWFRCLTRHEFSCRMIELQVQFANHLDLRQFSNDFVLIIQSLISNATFIGCPKAFQSCWKLLKDSESFQNLPKSIPKLLQLSPIIHTLLWFHSLIRAAAKDHQHCVSEY